MLKAFKYRIAPTPDQAELLNKHCGAVRFVYNLALETKTFAYSTKQVNVSRMELSAQLTDLKKECEWLKEVNSQSLQSALLNLDIAYSNFFKGTADFPTFKKKNRKQSFQCPQNVVVDFTKGTIDLPKFKEPIKAVFHRTFTGSVRTVTISRTPTGKYFASVLVDTAAVIPTKAPVERSTSVGVDLGIKTFAVLSDGTEYANPKHLNQSIDRLKVLQRRASKKKKGSNNRKKANRKVAVLHEKIANQRKDFLHKASDAITKRYDTVVLEDLAVANMVKNPGRSGVPGEPHKLARSISDAGWGMFRQFVEYKSEWRGKNVLTIGRFEPSSKLHNTCGYINKDLLSSDREWICPNCNELVSRDLNASINILNFGLLKHSGRQSSGEPVESPTLVGTLKQEKLKRASAPAYRPDL
ncbi:MAG: transposase [Rudanella sp.]|nr:transposase [Rudanella sp.]